MGKLLYATPVAFLLVALGFVSAAVSGQSGSQVLEFVAAVLIGAAIVVSLGSLTIIVAVVSKECRDG